MFIYLLLPPDPRKFVSFVDLCWLGERWLELISNVFTWSDSGPVCSTLTFNYQCLLVCLDTAAGYQDTLHTYL